MMQSKLPRSVLVTLAEMKPEGEEWTVENFQRLLKRHINAQEAGDLQKKLFQKRRFGRNCIFCNDEQH